MLLAVPVTLIGMTYLVTRALRDIAALLCARSAPPGRLVYSLHQTEDGRLLLLRRGEGRAGEADAFLPLCRRRHSGAALPLSSRGRAAEPGIHNHDGAGENEAAKDVIPGGCAATGKGIHAFGVRGWIPFPSSG